MLLPGLSLRALDVGLLLDQNANFTTDGIGVNSSQYEYSGTLIPRVSSLLGDTGEFIFSAGFSYQINPWAYMPELLRTEIALRFGLAELTMGRMPYRDPLGIIAEGFFDGVLVSLDTGVGTLSAGGWYTGFLYKKRAAIAMTEDEVQSYYEELNYGDFMDTYFAPRRVLASLNWEHPSLGGFLDSKLAVLGQFDLGETNLNSQYVTAKIALPFRYFVFDMGGCFELTEYDDEFGTAMAAEMGFTWMLPTPFENHIVLRGRFSSGVIEDSSIGAFMPLTTIPQGDLLQAKLSALSIISLNLLSRIHRTMSVDLAASYFIRSDLGTYTYYPVNTSDSGGFFLGAEIFWRFLWSISTGVQLNLGSGVFLPPLGNASPEADPLWRLEAGLIVSFY
jgi:hypothetical protein